MHRTFVLPMRPGRLALGAWLLALPLLAGAMPSQVATRTEKAVYLPAVNACKEAEAMIASDPRTAVATLDTVLENPKIRKIECLLRIELRPSEYTTPYEFTPYRYRGRAYVALAGRDGAKAVAHLGKAVADFTKSVEEGATESGPELKAAQAELTKAKAAAAAATPPSAPDPTPAVPVDPVAAFETEWKPLVDDGKFKSAMDLIAKRGASLPASDRKRLETDTRTRCRETVLQRMTDFRRELARVKTERELRIMTDFEFKQAFDLIPPDELVDPPPAYTWARAACPVFAKARAGTATGADLLTTAAAAVPLAEQGESQWFEMVEPLAFEVLQREIQKEVTDARDALRPEREAAQKRAGALLAGWRTFHDGLKPAIRSGRTISDHDTTLKALIGGFPVVPKALTAVNLDACFTAPNPDAELTQILGTLSKLAAQTDPPVAMESRRELHARRVIAGVLKALLEGRTEAEAATDVASAAQALKAINGSVDAKAYGPRVEQVVKKLKLGG